MRNSYLRWALLICFCWLLNLGMASAQLIDRMEPLLLENAPDDPAEVRIGIQIHQIKFVDQKSENFGIVGTLRLEWNDPALSFDAETFGRKFKLYDEADFRRFASEKSLLYPGFVIQNEQERRYKQSAGYTIFSNGDAVYTEQFSTVLQAPDFDFRSYPFDVQNFFVRIVSDYPESYVKFVELEGFSGLGEKLGEEEWIVSDHWTELSAQEGLTGLQSPRLSFGFRAHRHTEYYVQRIFIPIVILVLISWATFFLNEYQSRIEIAAANLLTFVALNFVISGDLPRLGYMTFMDAVLVTVFIFSGLTVLLNIFLGRLTARNQDALAQRIDQTVAYWVYPLIFLATFFWASFTFLHSPIVSGG